jgi:hypothetical protein
VCTTYHEPGRVQGSSSAGASFDIVGNVGGVRDGGDVFVDGVGGRLVGLADGEAAERCVELFVVAHP